VARAAACAGSLERSASTPLVSAPQKPKIAPAMSAIRVRERLDMCWNPFTA
jgi:hypothetical protein